MLNHLEQRQDIYLFLWLLRQRKAFNGRIQIRQFLRQCGILPRVRLCHREDLGRGINGRDGCCRLQARGRLGEDAAAAADVEVAERWGRWGGLRGVAGVDEVVAQRVHEMEEAGGAVRIPPRRGESIEVRDLGWGDGGAGGVGGRGGVMPDLEMRLHIPWGGAEEKSEVSEGGGR